MPRCVLMCYFRMFTNQGQMTLAQPPFPRPHLKRLGSHCTKALYHVRLACRPAALKESAEQRDD